MKGMKLLILLVLVTGMAYAGEFERSFPSIKNYIIKIDPEAQDYSDELWNELKSFLGKIFDTPNKLLNAREVGQLARAYRQFRALKKEQKLSELLTQLKGKLRGFTPLLKAEAERKRKFEQTRAEFHEYELLENFQKVAKFFEEYYPYARPLSYDNYLEFLTAYQQKYGADFLPTPEQMLRFISKPFQLIEVEEEEGLEYPERPTREEYEEKLQREQEAYEEQLRNEEEQAKNELEEKKRKKEEKKAKYQQLKKRKKELEDELNKAPVDTDEHNRLLAELELLKERWSEAQNEIKESSRNLNYTAQEIKKLETLLEERGATIQELEKKLREQERVVEQAKEKSKNFTKELNRAKEKLEAAQKEAKKTDAEKIEAYFDGLFKAQELANSNLAKAEGELEGLQAALSEAQKAELAGWPVGRPLPYFGEKEPEEGEKEKEKEKEKELEVGEKERREIILERLIEEANKQVDNEEEPLKENLKKLKTIAMKNSYNEILEAYTPFAVAISVIMKAAEIIDSDPTKFKIYEEAIIKQKKSLDELKESKRLYSALDLVRIGNLLRIDAAEKEIMQELLEAIKNKFDSICEITFTSKTNDIQQLTHYLANRVCPAIKVVAKARLAITSFTLGQLLDATLERIKKSIKK